MEKLHAPRLPLLLALAFSAPAALAGPPQLPGPPKSPAHCVLVGDSIAMGASAHAGRCDSMARKGITSQGWLAAFGQSKISADSAIISLGTNDGDAKSTRAALVAIRQRIVARRVMWIAPGPQFPARDIVISVGADFGDVVYERPVENLAKDEIHFDDGGYERIARLVK